jgi:hypothetical protein
MNSPNYLHNSNHSAFVMSASLIPANYFFQEPRTQKYVRRQLFPYIIQQHANSLAPNAPVAITESIRNHSVPYYVVLGVFAKRYFSLMVDEMGVHMYEVPIVAEKSYFVGGTIFFGHLCWEFFKTTNSNVMPRQVFFVTQVLRVAGQNMSTPLWADRYLLLRNLFDPLDKDILHRPREWSDEARKLARQHKIVCLGTLQCLTFRPKKWFSPTEIDLMQRTYIPTLRWLHEGLETCDEAETHTYTSRKFFLLVEANIDDDSEWDFRIYFQKQLDKFDATILGITIPGSAASTPLIFMPNDLIYKWVTSSATSPKTSIVLVEAKLMSDPVCIECEPIHLFPERQLPDSIAFITNKFEAC